jgi:NAD-dependent DNA ligase
MLKEGVGRLVGHQWGHELAIRGELYMAMDTFEEYLAMPRPGAISWS